MGGKVACSLGTAVYFDNCDFTLVRCYNRPVKHQLQPLCAPERKHLPTAGDAMRSIVVIKRREQGRKGGKAEPNSTTPLSTRVG